MEFVIKTKNEVKVSVENERVIDGITYFDVIMKADSPVVPEKFSVTWKINIALTPIHIYFPKSEFASFAVFKHLKIKKASAEIIIIAPKNPNSSQITLNMKSVCFVGRKSN